MFTGLIEQVGQVIANDEQHIANRLTVHVSFDALSVGESIAVNGVCLTLLSSKSNSLAFDVSPETRAVTNLSELRIGSFVNVERSLSLSGRLGGHFVSGHVDTTAYVAAIDWQEAYCEVRVEGFSLSSYPYLLPKGSITLDGVSLTINKVDKKGITLMLIPHTLAATTFSQLTIGKRLNVEFDYLTRVVVHQLTISGQLQNEVIL